MPKQAENPGEVSRVMQVLREQLQKEPDDHRTRIKLLEQYFEANRQADFLDEATRLRAALGKESLDWHMIARLGRSIAPGSRLFDEEVKLSMAPMDAAPAQGSDAKPTYKRLGEGKEYSYLFKQLADRYETAREDPAFFGEVDRELIFGSGRPSSLFHAKRLSERAGGAQIFIKREDLMPTDTMLGTVVIGQALFARRLGCTQLVTTSRDGHKGVIVAAIAARLGLEAVIYMDEADTHRHGGNIFRMWLHGASVEMVNLAKEHCSDIRDLALRHWLRSPDKAFFVMGLDAAPDPYPSMQLDFVAAVGRETNMQVRGRTQRSPDLLVARGGNNADAIGFFQPFIKNPGTRLVCVDCVTELEGAPSGRESVYNPATGTLSDAQKRLAESILEGLEYPSVTREHLALKNTGRVEYVRSGSAQAARAINELSRLEGLIPAIQTAQVIAWAADAAASMPKNHTVVVNMVERVDKDIWEIGKTFGILPTMIR